jgi:serine/threonine-protein kinase
MTSELIASRYRVIRELGRGGMGVVYRVEHLHTGEQLALKVLHGAAASDAGAIARFKREARVGAQIRSEHVVRVTDADVAPELGGAPFFVMELLEGSDLEKLIEKVGGLAPDVVVAVLSQITRALEKAHAGGIVHRDLKPENIFLHRREDGTLIAKILDFGISKFRLPDPNSTSLGTTADGTLMGTPHYMAPEQARGLVDTIGPATDMWAIGLIALRMLTGGIYWTAETQADLMVEILVAPMTAPSARWPHLGASFDAWFFRSCHRQPAERWRSASEQIAALADALRDYSPGDGVTTPRPASMVTVSRAIHGDDRAPVVDGPMAWFGSTPGSGTAAAGRTPPWSGPAGSRLKNASSTGSHTMAAGTSFEPDGTEFRRPRTRMLAISLGVGLGAGLVLAYLLTSPGSAPTAATTPSASVAAPPEPPPPPPLEVEPPRAVAIPMPADSAAPGRADPDTYDPPLDRRGRPAPPIRAIPAEKKSRGAAPVPRPPAPTSPPQDDPLAP